MSYKYNISHSRVCWCEDSTAVASGSFASSSFLCQRSHKSLWTALISLFVWFGWKCRKMSSIDQFNAQTAVVVGIY